MSPEEATSDGPSSTALRRSGCTKSHSREGEEGSGSFACRLASRNDKSSMQRRCPCKNSVRGNLFCTALKQLNPCEKEKVTAASRLLLRVASLEVVVISRIVDGRGGEYAPNDRLQTNVCIQLVEVLSG